MVLYKETVVCPVCGLKTEVNVQSWGDYDSPDKMEETDPLQCPSCQMLKISNPEIYKMVFALWQKLKDEREESEKKIQEIRKRMYSRNDLWSPFSITNDSFEKLVSFWKKTFKFYEKISQKHSKDGKDDSFEYERTVRDFVKKIIEDIQREKSDFENNKKHKTVRKKIRKVE